MFILILNNLYAASEEQVSNQNKYAVVSLLCNKEIPFYLPLWEQQIRRYTSPTVDIIVMAFDDVSPTQNNMQFTKFLLKRLQIHTSKTRQISIQFTNGADMVKLMHLI